MKSRTKKNRETSTKLSKQAFRNPFYAKAHAGKMRFEMASQNSVEALRPYVDRIMAALEELLDEDPGTLVGALVSDESFVSDFTPWIFNGRDGRDRREERMRVLGTTYKKLSERLGIELDSTAVDDRYIVRIAHKLKMRERAAST
jgi:hypothetical protein